MIVPTASSPRVTTDGGSPPGRKKNFSGNPLENCRCDLRYTDTSSPLENVYTLLWCIPGTSVRSKVGDSTVTASSSETRRAIDFDGPSGDSAQRKYSGATNGGGEDLRQ